MLTQVVLQTPNPMTFNVEAVDPDEILVIKSISGLSSVDLSLFTGEYSGDGGYYQGRRANKRNPVFNFKLNPDYANNIEVSDIREMLYKQFVGTIPGLDNVPVVLKDDRRPERYFYAVTEKIDTTMWERIQTAQVSMLCVDPYIRSLVPVSGVNSAGWNSIPVDYQGSAGTGITFKIAIKVATPLVNVVMMGALNQYMSLIKGSGSFAVNDVITVNTNIGSRSVKLNGVDAMNLFTPNSSWFTLNEFTTQMKSNGSLDNDGKAVITEYSYNDAWWGI